MIYLYLIKIFIQMMLMIILDIVLKNKRNQNNSNRIIKMEVMVRRIIRILKYHRVALDLG